MLVHYVLHVVWYCIPILILISSSNKPRNYGLVILYIDYLVFRYVWPVGLRVAYCLYNILPVFDIFEDEIEGVRIIIEYQ